MIDESSPELAAVVERLDHVSMAVGGFEGVERLIDLVGGTRFDGGYEAGTDFHWVQYDLPLWGRLEVIRTDSADPEHFINRFLATRGEGLHHLTFKVADLDIAVRRARALGFEVVGIDDTNPDWKEAFVHPRSASGVLIQFAEFPDDGS
jgi:catechol 2,3-dioxygenase-like lactoylglutathione lyase family enzyme